MSPASEWPPQAREQLALVLERNARAVVDALRSDAGAAPGRALGVLLAARTAADAVDEATSFAVAQARAAGHTWQEIGELLAITRQAAQQRFGGERSAPASERGEHGALAQRAAQMVEQIDRGEWDAVQADWNGAMRAELGRERLEQVWDEIVSTAGVLEGIGRATVTRKGPYRIADVPLVFEHGPMRARVTFDHTDAVSGLFILLPEDDG